MNTPILNPLPLGTSSFVELRRCGQIYVDKTAQIADLASERAKLYLLRPRRFGKSLLVSTFETLFADGLKHFQGLAIEKCWHDKTYPVAHLDFSSVREFDSIEDFRLQFARMLADAFAPQGFVYAEKDDDAVDSQLARWFDTLPGTSLVLLVDEYDAPLTGCLADLPLFNAVRSEMSKFFGRVKSKDRVFRFVFLTGTTRFNQLGLFSELNQFTDLTLDPACGTLLGYTEEELVQYFSRELDAAAAALGLTREKVVEAMRCHYDGYCFDDEVSTHVYAPWSVLNFLRRPSRGFRDCWISSGGSVSALRQHLATHVLRRPEDYGEEQSVPYDVLDSSVDASELNDLALLAQTGYLTIKRREMDTFFLGYPNREVAAAMATLYSTQLLNEKTLPQIGAGTLVQSLFLGDEKAVLEALNRTFLKMDYQQYPVTDEAVCRSYVLVILGSADMDVLAERRNALGCSDIEFDAGEWHWVMELKFLRENEPKAASDRLLQLAVTQMKARRYGESSHLKLKRLAMVFSQKARSFVRWQVVESEPARSRSA